MTISISVTEDQLQTILDALTYVAENAEGDRKLADTFQEEDAAIARRDAANDTAEWLSTYLLPAIQ